MKTPIRLLLAAAVCATAASAQAQSPAPTSAPAPAAEKAAKPDGDRPGRRFDRMTEGLPEETRERFKALRDEVLQDPELQELKAKAEAAGREFHDAMREKMRARDPELADKVRKHFDSRWSKGGKPGPGMKKGEPGGPARPALPPEQRDRLEKAREIAMQAPAVQSARAKMQAAETPEARHAAGQEYHEAMRAAMLTADPSLADVIDKLPQKRAAAPETAPEPTPEQP
jgi:hypothetical protein